MENQTFKFDIRHIGAKDDDAEKMVVGNTGNGGNNPYAAVDYYIYNADLLTKDGEGNIKYNNSSKLFSGAVNTVRLDPNAKNALIYPRPSHTEDNNKISAKSRLFSGMGVNGYAGHVQAWTDNYLTQTWLTPTGNVAAYGHLLVYGEIDKQHTYNKTNNYWGTRDLVQKEFVGEKDFQITDIQAIATNAITTGVWVDSNEEDESEKEHIYGSVGVQLAIKNYASQYNDNTRVDKTYVVLYSRPVTTDNSAEWVKKKVIRVEVPVGSTVLTDTVLDEQEIPENGLELMAQVNTGEYQTHLEYRLASSSATLNADPFINNYAYFTVYPQLPSLTEAPKANNSKDRPLPADVFAGD